MISDKKQLLSNLRHNTFCRLRRSSIHGVGLFAIREIPKGVNPFKRVSPIDNIIVDVSEEEVESLPLEIKDYIKNFFAKDDRNNYPVLGNGLNALDITFFLNHSDTPNVTSDEEYVPLDTYCPYKTLRKIEKGEELTQNYNEMFKDLKQFGIDE